MCFGPLKRYVEWSSHAQSLLMPPCSLLWPLIQQSEIASYVDSARVNRKHWQNPEYESCEALALRVLRIAYLEVRPSWLDLLDFGYATFCLHLHYRQEDCSCCEVEESHVQRGCVQQARDWLLQRGCETWPIVGDFDCTYCGPFEALLVIFPHTRQNPDPGLRLLRSVPRIQALWVLLR